MMMMLMCGGGKATNERRNDTKYIHILLIVMSQFIFSPFQLKKKRQNDKTKRTKRHVMMSVCFDLHATTKTRPRNGKRCKNAAKKTKIMKLIM